MKICKPISREIVSGYSQQELMEYVRGVFEKEMDDKRAYKDELSMKNGTVWMLGYLGFIWFQVLWECSVLFSGLMWIFSFVF